MKHFSIAVISILALFVIAGCQGGSSDNTGAAPRTPFLGGDNGLEIKFIDGSPPKEVADSGTFDFQAIVSLQNKGEFDLDRGQVNVDLIGFLPEDFGASQNELTDKEPEDDPSARKRDADGNIIEPTLTFITFPNTDSSFNFERSVTGNTVFVFRADVCYKYQTKALSRLCVLRDLVNVKNDDVCKPNDPKTVFSSGSPLKVTSFRETVAGQDKVSFSFDVTHSAAGNVFKEGDSSSPAASCPRDPRESREKENKVLVTVDTGLPNLRCVGLSGSTTGYITLVNGKRTVTCTQELDPGRNDFETNVEITLDFNYQDSVQQDVLVKHLAGS
ncbi:hypothetical protein HYU09_03475 [Candidatus Woesearchaeota archaeon]|nr:hypothetical protein [Candidatus Woesearchaeota archaeon]